MLAGRLTMPLGQVIRDGSLPRHVRDPPRSRLPLLHPAGVPGGRVRAEQAAADVGDRFPGPPGWPGALELIALGIGEATGHVETRAAPGWFEGKGRATLPRGARA